jgi:enhancing lycopene biosynthesis protein 2
MTLYAIAKNNCTYDIFAPNIEQHHVINHLTGQPTDEKRNVLIESARIARGKINDLADFKAQNYDALISRRFWRAKKPLHLCFRRQNANK